MSQVHGQARDALTAEFVQLIPRMTESQKAFLLEVMRMKVTTDYSMHELFVNLAPDYGIDPSVFLGLGTDSTE